ncbi:MAG: ATP-binding protein [Terracidiphilus sp.]|nr:ATP-binding protein [Terracidiphilus sp.]
MIRPLPIRLRLTLLYGSMFTGAALLLCSTALWMLQDSVKETEYHELQERADDVRSVLEHEDAASSPQELAHDLDAIYKFKDDGKYLQVRDSDGHWLFRSARMMAANPDLPSPVDLPQTGREAAFRQGIHEVGTLTYPITVHGKLYAVQTGLARDKSDVLLTAFRTDLLFLTPIVIVLAAFGGHIMSRTALGPVAQLTAEARRINDRNLDSRLPSPDVKDEISELAQTLNDMLERINRAFVSVRTFTGNASHELRTPIALLQTEIEVALMRPRTVDEHRAVLQQLHAVTVRMAHLIEILLALARADGGAEAMAQSPILLNTLLPEIADDWRSAMQNAQLRLMVEVPDRRTIVLGNQDGIVRLLSILLENARKYTPADGSVRLGSHLSSAGATIFVEDSGCGIAQEHLPYIFDRFYRVNQDSTSPEAGSGLGLALAKWIADRHGTELLVSSSPGKGSRFSFTLHELDESTERMASWGDTP